MALCWICNKNEADSAEHKTKRSDLAAVLSAPTQEQPLYFNDLERRNKSIASFSAAILKSPKVICTYCNTTRTQTHDRAWELMSARLRARRLMIGGRVRINRVFQYDSRRQMINVQLFFSKLFGCMLVEARSRGHEVPIDLEPFSTAIVEGSPHPDVYLQMGRCNGIVGRSNLHCWTTVEGGVLAAWLYQVNTIAVGVVFAPKHQWKSEGDHWHPHSGTKRLTIADFSYSRSSPTT